MRAPKIQVLHYDMEVSSWLLFLRCWLYLAVRGKLVFHATLNFRIGELDLEPPIRQWIVIILHWKKGSAFGDEEEKA